MSTRVIDLSEWTPDMDYEDCLKLCEELGLLETVQHGPHQYGRLTQKGINIFTAMMHLANYASYPENHLKKS